MIGICLIGVAHAARKRRDPWEMSTHTEACEERILLSATVMAAASAAKGSSPSAPKPLHVPSTAGPNGTTYLANDASTPPNWAQQQNATIVPPIDSEVNSTTPALNETQIPVGGAFNFVRATV